MVATETRQDAEDLQALLRSRPRFAGVETEVYGVNDMGKRLVPKGVEIVERVQEVEPPRPWNDRAGELLAMTPEELEANHRTIKGSDFLFTGDYRGPSNGTVVYIAPRSYFKQHETLWPEPLGIDHILPQDLKEVRPGIYRSRSRDWISINSHLIAIGMVESLGLQLAVNLMF